MRKFSALVAVFAVICATGVSQAAPFAQYNTVNGKIWFNNDLGGPLTNASLLSASSSLTDASAMLAITGATKDDSEFPDALTYLSLPVGRSDVGLVVKVGTPLSDLTFRYREPGVTTGAPIIGVIEAIVPEPASIAVAGMGLIGLITLRRRAC